MAQGLENTFGKKGLFWLIFAGVSLVLVGLSYWVITFVWAQVSEDEPPDVEDALSLIYIDYNVNPDDYISPESYLAMAAYQQQFPETQNVQVLSDLTTVEIIGYMINHMSAGLGVNCTYCHSLENFAADVWDDPVAMAAKDMARQHLRLTGDLNQNWLTQLASLTPDKQPSGAQITCAVCHNGQPLPNPWEQESIALPDSFRLPVGGPNDSPIPAGTELIYSVDELGYLNVNANYDVGLDAVQLNQYVMYHMNMSMNVGCTHCHNSRYFPSYTGVPAKYYAMNMLQMSQHIWTEWGDTFDGNQPSCYMCHQGAVIPPGAARSVDVMPDQIDSTGTLPPATDSDMDMGG